MSNFDLFFSAIGAIADLSSAASTNTAAEYSAQVSRQNAAREKQLAEFEAGRFHRRQMRAFAANRAKRAGSGLSDQGTPLLIENSVVEQIELDTEAIRRGGIARAASLEGQASLQKFKGRSAQKAAAFQAGESLLRGFSKSFPDFKIP